RGNDAGRHPRRCCVGIAANATGDPYHTDRIRHVPDPVANGFVTNLARPGGNITGFANYEPTIAIKWLELLKQIAPDVARVAFIYDPTNPTGVAYLRAIESAASSFGTQVSGAAVRDGEEIERAIAAFAREPNGGLVVAGGPSTTTHQAVVIGLAARHRLPAVYPTREAVTGGGLASYGVDTSDLFRRAASYVDRILKGEKPSDLPVQFANKFELVINQKTAKALGLDPSIQLLARTDDGGMRDQAAAPERRKPRMEQTDLAATRRLLRVRCTRHGCHRPAW